MSNPTLPRIRCLPKVHKPGNEMREIVTANNSPTYRFSRWLLKEFQGMRQFQSCSVKNSQEFVSKVQEWGSIADDEILVSFDVKALFPSIPVKETLCHLEDWLLQQSTDSSWRTKVRQYLKLTNMCMSENYFTFREGYYKATTGVAMGNPLSPFISEMFMSKFEEKLSLEGKLPEKWLRYVDDVFAVVKQDEVDSLLMDLNNRHKNIEFTVEIEKDGKLPFLDIMVDRNLSFGIYRKPTHTQRIIPSTSNHNFQQKMAPLHSMIHRLLSIPMAEDNYKNEE